MSIQAIEVIFRARTQGNLSDKWSSYLSLYDGALGAFRYKKINLLEIGVQNGGSLEIWADYFHNARTIVGVDIDPKCADIKFNDPRISVIVGDSTQLGTRKTIASRCSDFDIVIDDGSHKSGDIIRSFANYFPLLKNGGLYIIEDLHASYWQEFDGALYFPFSSMAFLKRLADVVNAEHWDCEMSPYDAVEQFGERYGCSFAGFPLDHIHSVTFLNSACIIKKEGPASNLAGVRITSGSVDGITKIDNSAAVHTKQGPMVWSSLERSETATERAFEDGLIERLQDQVDDVQKQLDDLQKQLGAVLSSTSWRITWPIRFLVSGLTRFLTGRL